MIKKNCSICEKPTKYEVIYNQYLPKNIKYIDYSARKNPDNYHYEMVRPDRTSCTSITDKSYGNKTKY